MQKSQTFHTREKSFIDNFFNHDDWMYEPCNFSLNGKKYCPDFYDRRRDVYIEVLGTRQAYQQNKWKYELLPQVFPFIILELRHPDGDLFDPQRPDWNRKEKAMIKFLSESKKTGHRLKMIRIERCMTQKKFGKLIGYSTTKVSFAERGYNITDNYIRRIVKTFGIEPKEILPEWIFGKSSEIELVDEEEFMKIMEVAQLLRVCRRTIDNYTKLKDDPLPLIKSDGLPRFRREAVMEWLARREQG